MLEIYFIIDGYNKNEVVKSTESLNFISIDKKNESISDCDVRLNLCQGNC